VNGLAVHHCSAQNLLRGLGKTKVQGITKKLEKLGAKLSGEDPGHFRVAKIPGSKIWYHAIRNAYGDQP
jgi:hypothetical protein